MAAKLTLFPARGASRYLLLHDGESRQAGRDPGANDFVIDDPRVSACHARVEWTGRGWTLRDLDSKNGTFVAGRPASGTPLEDEDWLSFGGLLAHFEVVSEEEIRILESERARRIQTTVEITQELARESDPRALLERLLQSVLSVTSAERGFVLLIAPDGTLEAEVASGFAAGASFDQFEGSSGAIERVLATSESVVVSDAASDAFLGRRPSVLEQRITTLACVPLRSADRVIGLIYVDGRKPGGAFTELDLEILEALAGNVSIVLSTVRIDREIRELLESGRESASDDRSFLDSLERRVTEIARNASAASPAAPGVPSTS
ncbi:MAG TPA: GAF domain-containing protein [Thermoanaerobaculia bacterium]